jgi:hypothetical protein
MQTTAVTNEVKIGVLQKCVKFGFMSEEAEQESLKYILSRTIRN